MLKMWRLDKKKKKKKKINFDICVVWWCSDGSMNRQEYKSFEIDAVTIKNLWLNITI